MTNDPAEKLLCKLLIHNKVLSKAEVKKILEDKDSWSDKILPDYLVESGKVKQAVCDKAVKFVESKGESFEQPDEEPLELDVADDIANGSQNNNQNPPGPPKEKPGVELAPGANASVEPKKSYGWWKKYPKMDDYSSSKQYYRNIFAK